MTTAPSLHRELHQLLSRFLLVVGYALGCLTLTSMFALLLAFFLSWPGVSCDKADRARLDLKNIANGLHFYRLKQGHYPSTEEGLRALVSAGVLENVPRDPWNSEYHYALRRGAPLVWSLGADGVPGGEGAEGDLYSRPLPP
jgi:general secretion pathway protein G